MIHHQYPPPSKKKAEDISAAPLHDDIQLTDDEYDQLSIKSSKGGHRSREKRRLKRGHSSHHPKRQQQQRSLADNENHRLAYSTVYNLASRLPSFGQHKIISNTKEQQHQTTESYSSSSQQASTADEDIESLVVSEPSFLREFDDMNVLRSKSAILIYILNVMRDILNNPKNCDLSVELEEYCNIARPFDVSQEFAKIEINIASTSYLRDPQKYCRLEADMPVKSFLWIVRDLSHHGRENDLFAEDLVHVLMSRKAIFYKLIPKILRWADNRLRQRFEAELGLHLKFLGKHFRKNDDDNDDKNNEQTQENSSISLIIKCEDFPHGQRIQKFQGKSFNDFKTFLSDCTKIGIDLMNFYRLEANQQIYDILDCTDIHNGMTCVVTRAESTSSNPQ